MASVQEKIFKCDFFTSTLVSGLKTLRETDQLTDVILRAQGHDFNCHKVILAANSKYFSSIFTADFKERGSEVITMPAKIDAVAIEKLLNYFYSGELALSQNNVESMFVATDYMRLDPLLEICIENMQKTLDPSNCTRRYVLADPVQYSSPRLDIFRRAASALIVQNAVKTSETVEFLSLSVKLIKKILLSNSQPERAESLYAVILKWVRHDEENRRQFLCELLETLAVDAISDEFFASEIRNEELLRRDPKSVLWLFDNFTLRHRTLPETQGHTNSLFIADCAWNRECLQVKVINPRPLRLSDRPETDDFSAVCHDKRIYLLCRSETENVYRLDGPQESWVECDLNFKLGWSYSGYVVLGDDLYIIGGGRYESGPLNSCVKLNFISGRKSILSPMREARDCPGAAVYANSVYAACGYEAPSSIERYDPREGRWCAVGRYGTKITWCSLATVDDYLYCCSVGKGKAGRFDFRTNRSQQICGLPSNNGSYIASSEGRLFGTVYGSVLKYDSVANKWDNLCNGIDFRWPVIVPWE